jgi:DNA-binding Lrp family transcriptional regulator
MADVIGAFVLVQSKPGKAFDVAKSIRKLKRVKWACAVTGVYDVIACVETSGMDSLSDLVINQIQPIEGIQRTHTAMIMTGITRRQPKRQPV